MSDTLPPVQRVPVSELEVNDLLIPTKRTVVSLLPGDAGKTLVTTTRVRKGETKTFEGSWKNTTPITIRHRDHLGS